MAYVIKLGAAEDKVNKYFEYALVEIGGMRLGRPLTCYTGDQLQLAEILVQLSNPCTAE